MLVNFSWIQDGQVAGMGLPDPRPWEDLRGAGVGAVLTLTERPLGSDPAPDDFHALHVPLVDFGTPSLGDLRRCVAFIDEQVEAGTGVAVHCLAGIGRTGTVLAAWLVSTGLSADEAIRTLRSKRPGSVETRGQADVVHRFEEEIRA